MFGRIVKRMTSIPVLPAGLALMLVAGVLIAFAGDASAAKRARPQRAKGCLAVLAGATRVDKALSELVADNTLTQAQADAVRAKIAEDSGKGAKTCAGLALMKESGVAQAVEQLLGMTGPQIKTEFKNGKSLAEMASAKNIDRATLVKTINTALGTAVDKLATNGKISAAQAETIKTDIAARVEKLVDLHKGDLKAGKGASATPAATATPAM
jgi:uncharacterized protein YidB (DUF937 family)